MRGSRLLTAAVLLLPLLACGREGERGVADGAVRAGTEAPPPAEPAAAVDEEPPPLDSAAVARALAEDEALEAENRATYEARLRSMGGYAACMAQTRDLPAHVRGSVEAACERRREAP